MSFTFLKTSSGIGIDDISAHGITNIFIALLFIIFAFTWNPKTVITGDVASFPLYRIIYKFIKIYLI